jgi:hypothetical protein
MVHAIGILRHMAYSLLELLNTSPIRHSDTQHLPFPRGGGAFPIRTRTAERLRKPIKEIATMATLIIVPRYIALLKNYSSKPRLTNWLKGHGQFVEAREPLVVIETTKASIEIESPATGLVLVQREVRERVNIGDTLGVIASDQDEFDTLIEESRERLIARQ